jgi:hypothetical protein
VEVAQPECQSGSSQCATGLAHPDDSTTQIAAGRGQVWIMALDQKREPRYRLGAVDVTWAGVGKARQSIRLRLFR